jgi:hypothetical protein
MPVERYRIKEPTIAMSQDSGRGIAITVSAGSVVEVEKAFDGDQLVDVKWDGKVVMMFTQDLRWRAERII